MNKASVAFRVHFLDIMYVRSTTPHLPVALPLAGSFSLEIVFLWPCLCLGSSLRLIIYAIAWLRRHKNKFYARKLESLCHLDGMEV